MGNSGVHNSITDVKNLRILIVDLSKRYGGASTRAIMLAQHLYPWDVAIAGLNKSPVTRIAKEQGIPVHTIGNSRLDPRIPFRLAEIIQKHDYHIIDTQNIQSKFWGSMTALLANVALVSTLNSSYSEEYGRGLKGKLYEFIDLHTNWRTGQYIAVSDAIKLGLINSGISAPLIHVIRNSVEVSGEILAINSIELLREQIGIPKDAILCTSVGRLVWAKGYEDLVKAFEIVVRKVPRAYVVIVGSGELHAPLLNQIKEAGLERRMFLLGFCDSKKVQAILKSSDLFLMPSRTEGVPYALLEAAAVGLPIIATNCGGIPEVVTDKIEALLVPVGDINMFSSAVIDLCENRNYANELGMHAREKIKKEYNLSLQIAAVKKVYVNALGLRGNDLS